MKNLSRDPGTRLYEDLRTRADTYEVGARGQRVTRRASLPVRAAERRHSHVVGNGLGSASGMLGAVSLSAISVSLPVSTNGPPSSSGVMRSRLSSSSS